jgi:diguanylate cyclase (GGDEF)-like protein
MYQPVFTGKDSLVGYLVADLPMHQILGERKDFLWKVSLPLLGLTSIWCLLFFFWLYISVISPIRAITRSMKNESLRADDNANVHTGDEIENLYHLIQKREKAMETSFSTLFKTTWKREHDALTELYNKEKFESLRETDYQNLCSVGIVYVDINYLKMFNEMYGHPVGDIVIKKAARHVDRFLEDYAQGFRMGGDEFLIVCPNVAKSSFINMVQLMKDSSPALNRSSDAVHCSLAIGYSFAEDAVRLEDVMAQAEMAMYAEKKRIKEEQG